jgi:hypothetical protein
MYTLDISNEEKPEFQPFTLNIRLLTKETARNLWEMLEPIIYSRPDGEPSDVVLTDMNGEQRQLAEDICNILSENVNDISNT